MSGGFRRRNFIKSIAAAGAAGTSIGIVAARRDDDSESAGPYFTRINSTSFGGQYTPAQELPGQRERIRTTDFLVPDLSVTPHTVEQNILYGVSAGAGDYSIATEKDDTRLGRHEIPVAEASKQFDDEMIGYRIVGDLCWETINGVNNNDIVSGEKSHVEYEIIEVLPNGDINDYIDVSEGCSSGGTSGYIWKHPRHKIVAEINPRKYNYEIRVDTARGAVKWTLNVAVQAVVATPRPEYGNNNGFRDAGEQDFNKNRPTSMSDIDGYTVTTSISTDAEIASGPTKIKLRKSPWRGKYGPYCGDLQTQDQTTTDSMETPLDPGSYRYIIEPQDKLNEWDIDLNVYKRVVA